MILLYASILLKYVLFQQRKFWLSILEVLLSKVGLKINNIYYCKFYYDFLFFIYDCYYLSNFSIQKFNQEYTARAEWVFYLKYYFSPSFFRKLLCYYFGHCILLWFKLISLKTSFFIIELLLLQVLVNETNGFKLFPGDSIQCSEHLSLIFKNIFMY